MKNENLGTIYANQRAKYDKHEGVYALGTFTNTDESQLTGTATQLFPTERTLKNFATVSKNGYTKNNFNRDQSIYTINSDDILQIMTDMLGDSSIKITAEITEFLEGIGNQQPEHMVSVSQITAPDDSQYYLMQAGVSALEASNNALKISEQNYDHDLFTSSEDNINIIEDAMPLFVLEYVNHILDLDLSPAKILETSDIGQDFDEATNSNLLFIIIHMAK
ncbi:hypothetical protein FC70_GL001209 [Paucilactobacillus oligofermentans DSM 15707 = LMG 22743]|uniref:Uncharacterized protein n=1 Tax=Paucilactobacillus oligofermentans DSM 15707 = LMG 22743 TaxID=1423778 RepID=A0A0R1RFF0_9LACO|nr:hypothetical protein [Paucilactobacillus oligofermentans]KRL55607.1 hypothetical protein FC70_GL001209 [Paucilactobacillus oligofermentans DSM 15707 = LMG 22743]CUS25404.1 Uncharacterized protein LACOL_0096 [Paucilactobacillus oligofermentans DSM 15707 = LMG 22743]